ncbi:putative trans-sulfuration enzyme [Spathaspora sp. JA1]|nr:putative trans-sulfuration enzyme [Spathaspora sp. JA1]
MHITTKSIHGADSIRRVTDVIPPINISTTFSYSPNPEDLVAVADLEGTIAGSKNYIYSRENHPNAAMVEQIVESITGVHAVVYNSGLGAFNALMTLYNPKTLAIGQAYHGCQGIADIWQRNFGLKKIDIDASDEEFDKYVKSGDLVHLETPVNPYGVNFDIKKYAERAHAKEAILSIDATFAPPPLMDPFKFGADIVMHSATKFFGGHSDLLAGILLTKSSEIKKKLLNDRLVLGSNIGNLESALLVRSLRTYELRILRQSKSAEFIVKYLNENKSKFPDLDIIHHGSLQTDSYIKEQMPLGQSPVFAIELKTEIAAKSLPSKLKLFYHATSLGGAESLIEWRAMSDAHISRKLLRVSIGLEDPRDLLADLVAGLGGDDELVTKISELSL